MNEIDIEQLLKDVVWAVIEKNYNVDKDDPRVLTYKHVAMPHNPIDEVAAGAQQVFEQIFAQLQLQEESRTFQEEEYDDDDALHNHLDAFGDYFGVD